MPTPEDRPALIEQIRALPAQLRDLVADLSDEELTTAYLPGEWTVAQNVHHLADSHMHSYIRCKFILTEDHPTLKPYDQAEWATLADATPADVSSSLRLLEGLHARWAQFFESLGPDDWKRAATHPEHSLAITLDVQLAHYAKHGEDHLEQIRRTLAAKP
ncbi:MAG: putative metal-dependent hydrolase [Chloroflexi bacterium]|nr:putative metal-dependent hydrolase [Chloroflexota bacterium]